MGHDEVIQWKHLPRYWRLVKGIHQRIPLTKANDVGLWYFFFDLRLNKRLRKQSRRRWFETPSRSLWHHCNDREHQLTFQSNANEYVAVWWRIYGWVNQATFGSVKCWTPNFYCHIVKCFKYRPRLNKGLVLISVNIHNDKWHKITHWQSS